MNLALDRTKSCNTFLPLHQENGQQLFFDAHFRLLFTAYLILYYHIWKGFGHQLLLDHNITSRSNVLFSSFDFFLPVLPKSLEKGTEQSFLCFLMWLNILPLYNPRDVQSTGFLATKARKVQLLRVQSKHLPHEVPKTLPNSLAVNILTGHWIHLLASLVHLLSPWSTSICYRAWRYSRLLAQLVSHSFRHLAFLSIFHFLHLTWNPTVSLICLRTLTTQPPLTGGKDTWDQ